MKEMMSSLVRGVRVRESSCPVGARIAVLSYGSHTRHLIRFSDAYKKSQLLREMEAIPYERSSDSREIGKAMRFISRNVFKRTLPGAHARRIATFFSSGQSADVHSVTMASMEFSALDIVPVVIAFSNVPSVKRAFANSSVKSGTQIYMAGLRSSCSDNMGWSPMFHGKQAVITILETFHDGRKLGDALFIPPEMEGRF
ncbi:hypothetical protein MC885_007459 [Smutsia gigantea]|nr:hypothetical protein MC885_007459 [Smutsia gigantea]